MGDTEQVFKSEETEWSKVHSAFSSETMKDIDKQFRSVKGNAGFANEAIRTYDVGLSTFTEALTYIEIDSFKHKTDVLDEFSGGVHQDVLDLIDDPFNASIGELLEVITTNGDTVITDNSRSLQTDVTNILSGVNMRDNTKTLTQDEINELEKSFDPGTVQKLVDLISTATGDKGTYYYVVDGFRFTVSRDGNTFHVVNALTGRRDVSDDARRFLTEMTGDNWVKREARRAMKNGSSTDNLLNTDVANNFKELDDVIVARQGGAAGIAKNAASAGWDTFKEGMTPFGNTRGFIKAAKAGDKLGMATKGLGIVSTGITVVSDFTDNCVDEYGNVNLTAANLQKTATDVGVDLLAGAGSAAVGAAVGSCFMPPLGTAVGFLVGCGVDWAMNHDFTGDGKSLVDNGKDLADDVFDALTFGIFS